MKILPGLTTTSGSDWREKIREIDRLGVRELALFPTCLPPAERKTMYELLEQTGLETIPHVHLRNDFTRQELEYLTEKYQTRVFNTHSEKQFKILDDWSDWMDRIYIENATFIPDRAELERFAGLCLDFAHWENGRLQVEPVYSDFREKCRKYRIGCCHVSAIKTDLIVDEDPLDPRENGYDCHWLDELAEVDYMQKYTEFLPEIVSIELENPLARQLNVIERLKMILKGSDPSEL